MSEIVLGVGASHTTLMNTQWDKVEHLPRAHAFRDALATASMCLQATRPDAVIVIGSNHFRGFWLDLMPAFTIGVGEVVSSGEHGTPVGSIRSDRELGLLLCEQLTLREIDVAFSDRLAIDHGISHACQWLLAGVNAPVVPLVINCFAPPLPTLRRSEKLGAALRAAILEIPDARRIAIIATGGLSHQLPFPDWRRPEGSDEVFLANSWSVGRGNWQAYEARRRSIILGAVAQINSTFDQWFLELLKTDGLSGFSSRLSDSQLVAEAGNGGNEVRTWLTLASAMGNEVGRTIAYSAMPEWLTGMAVAVIEPVSTSGDSQ